MLRVGLGEFQGRRIAFHKVHAAEVCPQAMESSPCEPVSVSQPAEHAEFQQFGRGRLPLAAMDEDRGEQRVQRLDGDLPHEQ